MNAFSWAHVDYVFVLLVGPHTDFFSKITTNCCVDEMLVRYYNLLRTSQLSHVVSQLALFVGLVDSSHTHF